jgi:predicted Zn finger-like uncharacterized protein
MDVRCERCRAQYVFDDEQVTPGGLTVQCTNCGHVFKVKVKELVVTVPVKPGEMEGQPIPATAAAPKPGGSAPHPPEHAAGPAAAAGSPAVSASPPAPASFLQKGDEKSKEWRVRQSNGNVFTFKELTTLQKWIVEQKVTRDDEISLSGDQWKRLGNIAELASFFQVVEAAETARSHPAGPAVTPIPMPTVSVYPVVQAPPGYPPGYPQPYPPGYPASSYPQQPYAQQPALTPSPGLAHTPAPRPQQPSAQRSARPVGRAVDVKLDGKEFSATKRGGAWKALLALLVVAGGAAGGLYAWRPELLGLAPRSEGDSHQVPITIQVQPGTPGPSAGDPVTPQSDHEAPGSGDQTPLPAPVQEGGEAPLPTSPVPVAKPEPPVPAPAAAPASKGPKQLLADAERLRTRGALEKAVGLYERVIEAQPGNARALVGRGLCYLDLQQYALAEQSFQAALQADPEEADALLGLAEAARYQGKKSEAIQHYERYLALHPDGDDAVAARNAINQLKE